MRFILNGHFNVARFKVRRRFQLSDKAQPLCFYTVQTMKNHIIHKVKPCALLLFSVFFSFSCNNKPQGNSNWLQDDDVKVAIDETFKPIMDNLVGTFGMSNPEANMKPVYVSEDSAIRMLVNDSVRCCIATRKLNDNEKRVIKSHTLGFNQSLIASDAIALVVNKESNDTLISLEEIKGIVSGKITRWEQLEKHAQTGELKLVFDNSGSSTVRYMKDSLCAGHDLKGNVFASEGRSNQSVLEMVKADPTIIGVVGTNWVKGDSETPLSDFSKLDFKVMRVSRDPETYASYVRPYQYYIATGTYPLVRSVYIIHTDPRSKSFVRSFYFFAKGQKGQTIICNNSQLLPITPVQIKNVNVN